MDSQLCIPKQKTTRRYSSVHSNTTLDFGPQSLSRRLEIWSFILVSEFCCLHEYLRMDWLIETDHEAGGHFPGLDNPPALLEDLREIATYWSK